MSKAVSSVGRAIGSVVKGVVNTAKSVISGVSKMFGDSKFGRILLTAAAIYFGGAALMGGFGASAAGGSFLSGMGAGISSAASGISGAWSAITAGEMGAAGSSLASGFTGANAAGAATVGGSAVAGGAGTVANGMTQAEMLGAQNAGLSGADKLTAEALKTGSMTGAKTAAAGSSIWNSPYTAPAVISGGSALIGGAMQGKALQDQRNFEIEQQRLARERYGANVGTRLWGEAPTDSAPPSGPTAYQSMGYDERLSSSNPEPTNYQQIDPATGRPLTVADMNRRSAIAFNQIWQRPGLVGNYVYMNPSIYG